MSERATRHGEIHHMVVSADSDRTFEKNSGYPAPKTPFEMPTMTPGPGQGATPAAGSDGQSQTSTTSASDD